MRAFLSSTLPFLVAALPLTLGCQSTTGGPQFVGEPFAQVTLLFES